MTDLFTRAAKIFGTNDHEIDWPYGIETPPLHLRRTDPDAFNARLPLQRAKQEAIVGWAEEYGLKRSVRGCCPRWLQRRSSRTCRPSRGGDSCTHYGGGRPDAGWLDHPVGWLKDGRPAALTSAPYQVLDEDLARIKWWTQQDPLLRYSLGDGWYGHGTRQVVLWRTDWIERVDPVVTCE
ncbi:hypothetical protein [Streptomyces sp. CB03911]|uniref:hypothetical protein n=1 Tax=Streptomyces sp. CB03911 TaxID=1804758 RepID=UPI00093D6BFA|nr:hypothetical protein [Streptomyces sp. CB03911]OKI16589.1 hypothetical protein A6A07_11315 [Streptomyces sp. CB03911]